MNFIPTRDVYTLTKDKTVDRFYYFLSGFICFPRSSGMRASGLIKKISAIMWSSALMRNSLWKLNDRIQKIVGRRLRKWMLDNCNGSWKSHVLINTAIHNFCREVLIWRTYFEKLINLILRRLTSFRSLESLLWRK